MFWKRKHAVIHVEFLDQGNGACFAESDIPIEQLPQSFEASTTMHLGDKDYDVVEAVPMTSEEFGRTGKLRLLLRIVKIERIDPKELLFSLPTIADELPRIAPGTSKLGKDVLELHEDDWRQAEFVEASAWPKVEEHLMQIRRVYEEERVEIGFRNLHVRKNFLYPLKGAALTEDAVKLAAGVGPKLLDGIAFYGVAGLVENGFAVGMLSGLTLYGTAPGGIVESLCIVGTPNNAARQDVPSLAQFANANNLIFVDWCRCETVDVTALADHFAR